MIVKQVKLNNNQPYIYLPKDKYKEGDKVEIKDYNKSNKEEALEWIEENKEKIQEAREQLKIIGEEVYLSPEYQALHYIQKMLNIEIQNDEGVIFKKGECLIDSDYCWDIVETENYYSPEDLTNEGIFFKGEFNEKLGDTVYKFDENNINKQNLKDSIDLQYFYNLWSEYFKHLERSFDNVFKNLGFTEFQHDEYGACIVHKDLPIVLNYSYQYEERKDFTFSYIDKEKKFYQELN